MSQLQTAAQPNAEPMASLHVQPAGALGRSWIPKIAILVAMAAGLILANTQAAISLADGGIPIAFDLLVEVLCRLRLFVLVVELRIPAGEFIHWHHQEEILQES